LKLFQRFDKSNHGYLTTEEMQELIEKTQLPKSECRQIWDLSNSQGLSQFNKPMFLIAMHLMYKRKKNP